MSTKSVYDVLIVGAGPAGSSAAYFLARMGASVLLVDRQTFPRAKACGDAIMPPAQEELKNLGLLEQVVKKAYPSYSVASYLDNIPLSKNPVIGYVLPRSVFDEMLRNHALKAGAHWQDNIIIDKVENKASGRGLALAYGRKQCGNLYEPVSFRARIIIIANGSRSRLAQQLRARYEQEKGQPHFFTGEDPTFQFYAIRGYIPRPISPAILKFFMASSPAYQYAWDFPLPDGKGANVGVIANLSQLRASSVHIRTLLMSFLYDQRMNYREQMDISLLAAPIDTGLRGAVLCGEHLLIAGDAAALAEPRFAEGISGALISGRVAAETAIKALRNNICSYEALAPYEATIRRFYQHYLSYGDESA